MDQQPRFQTPPARICWHLHCPYGQSISGWLIDGAGSGWLQQLWRDLDFDKIRTAHALRWLANDPRVGKILVEPHLVARMGVSHPKIRFQGCRAARHDDHIHLQL